MPESKGYIPGQDKWIQTQYTGLSPKILDFIRKPQERTPQERFNALLTIDECKIVSHVFLLMDVLSVLTTDYLGKKEWALTVEELKCSYFRFPEFLEIDLSFYDKNSRYGQPVSIFLHHLKIDTLPDYEKISISIIPEIKGRNSKILGCVDTAKTLGIDKTAGELLTASRAFHCEVLAFRGRNRAI